MTAHVALLRAINLGARNKIGMAELRAMFADHGYEGATTYLQSGNVVFEAPEDDATLAGRLERAVAERFSLDIRVMLRTAAQIAGLCAHNPYDQEPDHKKLHVAFLAEVTAAEKVAALRVPGGAPDEYTIAGKDVYLHFPQGYHRAKLSNNVLEKRLGVAGTARNWRTVLAVDEMLREL